MDIKLQVLMETQFSCPLRVACAEARSTVLGRSATTGLVRSKSALRAPPTTCSSIRTTWSGTTPAVALMAWQCVQSASRIYPLFATGRTGFAKGVNYFLACGADARGSGYQIRSVG